MSEATPPSTPDQPTPEGREGRADPNGRDEHWTRRSKSFGAEAAAYARYRPGYPAAAVQWALQPVEDRRPLRVIDLGAGTGKLTMAIAALGDAVEVTAVEPDPGMLAELRRQLPQITALEGRAEDIPRPDGSADAVLCGQSAHWFTMDKALPEIARVLAPGGVFAGLWNMDDDRVPWVAELSRLHRTNVIRSSWQQDRAWDGAADGDAWFAAADKDVFDNPRRATIDSLLANIATHSQQLVMAAGERQELLDRLRSYLESRPETSTGEFIVPTVTGILRSVKK